MKAWHDTPTHIVDGEVCGPVVLAPESGHMQSQFYRCGACGADVELTDAEKAQALKAEAAWDAECRRQSETAAAQREHDRKVPLLAEAIARRKARMAREKT